MRHKASQRAGCGRGLRRVSALALILALFTVMLPARGIAQTTRDDSSRVVVIAQPVGIMEAALASCAGGAMIGYLLVAATGPGSPGATATLFCGLSAAATVTSSVTFWAWRSVTALLP